MEVLYPRCAGLDVHKDMVVACVRHMLDGAIRRAVRSFKTTTAELLALSEWLASEGCTHVAMEATGVYWKPVWHILSDGDFALIAGQCGARQERAWPQDRRQRRHLAGRSAGAWPDPRQFRARSRRRRRCATCCAPASNWCANRPAMSSASRRRWRTPTSSSTR